MCQVEGPCEAGWKEQLPKECPPKSAQNAAGQTYYRLLRLGIPMPIDFMSHEQLQIPNTAPECEARSVSLVTHLAAARAKLLPANRRWASIAAVTLAEGSGAIFVRKTHVHWWPCSSADPVCHCVIVP
jgi:hypothetical protein